MPGLKDELDKKTPLTIEQSLGWRQHIKLTIAEDKLTAVAQNGAVESNGEIPLEAFDDLTFEASPTGRNWIFIAVLCFFATLALVALPFYIKAQSIYFALCVIAAIITAILSAFCCNYVTKQRKRRLGFILSRYNGEVLLVIDLEQPTPELAGEFLDRMLAEARKISHEAEEQAKVSVSTLAAPQEIRRFYQLMKDDIITNSEFITKKKSIITAFLKEVD